ncbi:MAG TPA: hypothetical protein VMD02_00490 [Candidatus Omnitrophota bacterium]|nr:hypothetical protein [Candidatus Omnitrophota bacterium]
MSYNLTPVRVASIEMSFRLQGRFFDRMFPGAITTLRDRAVLPSGARALDSQDGFFLRGQVLLPGSVAFFDPQSRLLITDRARLDSLPHILQDRFVPTEVLESRSHRARFFVADNGATFEFKGLTPRHFNLLKLNPNSNQPKGLFGSDYARNEHIGLDLIGGVSAGVNELGGWFGDLNGFSQLMRASAPGERFYPWMRMDDTISAIQLLAELEGKPLETFLFESHFRLGRQLRQFHQAGLTLCNPFRNGTAPNEPFFSSLHSGNVEPHGNLIDLEGMRSFSDAAEAFNYYTDNGTVLPKQLTPRFMERLSRHPFSFVCRVADLHRYLESRNNLERSLFKSTFSPSGRHRLFQRILSGMIHGYYREEMEKDATLAKDTDNFLDNMIKFMTDSRYTCLRFATLFRIFEEVEGQTRPELG